MILALAAPEVAVAEPEIHVLAVSDDVDAAARLQYQLEQWFPEAGGAERLRAALGAPSRVKAPQLSKQDRELVDNLMSQAKDAYYQGELDRALGLLNAVAVVHKRQKRIPADDLIEFHTWRVSVNLAKGDRETARLAADDALALDPDLKVDLGVFNPLVQDLIDEVRAGLPVGELRAEGLPGDAVVWVDDRKVELPARVPPGRHRVVVWAPRLKPVESYVEVRARRARKLGLVPPVNVSPVRMDHRRELMALGRRSAALPLLVVQPKGEGLVAALVSDAEVSTTEMAERKGPELVAWVEQQREALQVAAGTRAPVEGMQVLADGSVLLALRSRKVKWDDCSGSRCPRFTVGGIGPQVDLRALKKRLYLTGRAEFVSYHLSQLKVTNEAVPPLSPEQHSFEVNAGGTLTGRAGVGRALIAPGRLGEGRLLAATGGLLVVHRAGRDVVDGGSVGIFPSSTRLGADLRGSYHDRLAPTLSLDAELGWQPFNFVAEHPAGTTGERPHGGGFDWMVRASFVDAPWDLSVGVTGRYQTTRFADVGDSRLVPTPEDAKESNIVHALTITLTREL